MQVEVGSAIDDSHPAASDLAVESVALLQNRVRPKANRRRFESLETKRFLNLISHLVSIPRVLLRDELKRGLRVYRHETWSARLAQLIHLKSPSRFPLAQSLIQPIHQIINLLAGYA